MLLEKLVQDKYDGTCGLYVCVTPTKRSADILEGIGNVLNMKVIRKELHVTLMYSQTAPKNGSWELSVANPKNMPGFISGIDLFGKDKDHLVVTLSSHEMQDEHKMLTKSGATHSWSEFKPHVTLGKIDGLDLDYVNKMIPLIEPLIKEKELWFENYGWYNLSEDD